MIKIEEFIRCHDPFHRLTSLSEWNRYKGLSADEVWCRKDLPEKNFVWLLTQPKVLSVCDLRKYTLFCVDQVRHLLPKGSKVASALEVLRAYTQGKVSKEELRDAETASWGGLPKYNGPGRYAARAVAHATKSFLFSQYNLKLADQLAGSALYAVECASSDEKEYDNLKMSWARENLNPRFS